MNNFKAALLFIVVLGLAVAASSLSKKLGALRDPLQVWDALNNVGLLPIRMRGWIFSTVVGIANPYSRSINFRITELRKGKACGVMKYIKVARGLLTASSIVEPIKDRSAKEFVNEVLIKNAAFETVAKLTLTWNLDLKDK
ncbi:hypothetical protein BGZ98_008526 [Dissophora globulifera]|nr:hypothetical protein BGZ98_008526 [Dissophora globulifera]